MSALRRFWINQPSSIQTAHALHGQNVIAAGGDSEYVDVYFTQGAVISARLPRYVLSPGWRTYDYNSGKSSVDWAADETPHFGPS